MTQHSPEERPEPVIRDKRRINPNGEAGVASQTPAGEQAAEIPNEVPGGTAMAEETPGAPEDLPGVEVPDYVPDDLASGQAEGEAHPDTVLAEQRLADLLRERADFTNYRNRITRERALDKEVATAGVVQALLPVLDDIHSARTHGDLSEGPMAAIVAKLEDALAKFGVESIVETGVTFDPTVHEAMMADPNAEVPEGVEGPVVTQVMQPGYRVGERLVRAARVIVSG